MLGDALSALLDRAKVVYEPPAASPASSLPASASSPLQVPATPPSTTEEPSSPGGFTIADSDDSDSDDPPASPSKSAGLKIDITPPEEALDAEEEGEESVKSPIESQSRSLTLEEGEVFRKGSALGTGEVDEEDEDEATVTGEELKKEVCGLFNVVEYICSLLFSSRRFWKPRSNGAHDRASATRPPRLGEGCSLIPPPPPPPPSRLHLRRVFYVLRSCCLIPSFVIVSQPLAERGPPMGGRKHERTKKKHKRLQLEGI